MTNDSSKHGWTHKTKVPPRIDFLHPTTSCKEHVVALSMKACSTPTHPSKDTCGETKYLQEINDAVSHQINKMPEATTVASHRTTTNDLSVGLVCSKHILRPLTPCKKTHERAQNHQPPPDCWWTPHRPSWHRRSLKLVRWERGTHNKVPLRHTQPPPVWPRKASCWHAAAQSEWHPTGDRDLPPLRARARFRTCSLTNQQSQLISRAWSPFVIQGSTCDQCQNREDRNSSPPLPRSPHPQKLNAATSQNLASNNKNVKNAYPRPVDPEHRVHIIDQSSGSATMQKICGVLLMGLGLLFDFSWLWTNFDLQSLSGRKMNIGALTKQQTIAGNQADKIAANDKVLNILQDRQTTDRLHPKPLHPSRKMVRKRCSPPCHPDPRQSLSHLPSP